jgi:hypothetical protein
MTINERAKTTGLIVAFILASAALSAIAAPRAPTPDDAQEVDRIRAAITANAEKAPTGLTAFVSCCRASRIPNV